MSAASRSSALEKPGVELGIGRDVVDQREGAAALQHAPHLGHEGRHVGEMMRGDAAGDEIEARVLEGQRLGVRARRLHVGEALGLGELGRLLQHLLGEVAGDRRGRRAARTPPPCARRRWRRRAPARTAAAAPARPGGRGSRPWRARSRWHRPPHARRTAAARGIWSCEWAPGSALLPFRPISSRTQARSLAVISRPAACRPLPASGFQRKRCLTLWVRHHGSAVNLGALMVSDPEDLTPHRPVR